MTAGRADAGSRTPRSLAWRASIAGARALMDLVSYGLRSVPAGARYLPADTLVLLLSPLLARVRRTARRNFAIMLGCPQDDPRVQPLVAASLRNFARMAADFLRVRTMTPEDVLAWGEPAGENHLAAALEQGKGAIFALAHFGSWDFAAAYAQAYGLRLTIITENDWASELVASSRQSRGLTLAPRDHGLRLALKALRRNECVAIITDIIRPGFPSVEVPFLGHLTPFPLGPARIAVKTGAPVLVVSSIRSERGRYRIAAAAPLWMDESASPDEAAARLTAEIAARLEQLISEHPDQWYPFRPFWPQLEVSASERQGSAARYRSVFRS